MYIFSSMFKKTDDYRNFALLDANGVCVAFKRCAAKPENGQWVEVDEFSLSWLGHPLPHDARIV